jgi:purine nucleosidase
VVIDCDVGVDDAFALILAFHSPELEVKAVTGVNGNVPLNQVFENIQKVLSLIQPEDKPLIAQGADRPLKGKPVYAHSVHGKDGLGGAKIDRREECWETFPGRADELIVKMAHQYPNELTRSTAPSPVAEDGVGKRRSGSTLSLQPEPSSRGVEGLTLIATGPLTNLALALQKDPEGMRKLKEVVIMGGAVRTKGNITPYAEFNIYSDPCAAKLVFESGLPITLVPLDVTHQVFLTPPLIEERVKAIQNRFSQFLVEAIGYDFTIHRFREKEKIYLHDPLAVGVVIESDLVRKERASLDVNTQEGEHYGQMQEVQEGPKVEVCLDVDAKKFLDLFVTRLA